MDYVEYFRNTNIDKYGTFQYCFAIYEIKTIYLHH